MKIRVELYGNKIGVDGNLAELIEKKEVQLLLTISSRDDRNRMQVILNKEDALDLQFAIDKCLNDPVLAENGFRIV